MSASIWSGIFGFEIRYHLRQPLFYLTSLALFLLAFSFTATGMAADVEGLPGSVNRNAPFVLLRLMSGLTSLALFVVTAFVSSSALRDFRLGSHMLFFSRPIGKLEYLTGRFAGSMVISTALMAAGLLGVMAGAHSPWHGGGPTGPFSPGVYLYGLVVFIVPNLLMMGGIFFAVSILSRSLMASYIMVVIFVVLQDEAEMLVSGLEHATLGSLIEPLGIAAMSHVTRYWTVAEYNSLLPGFAWQLVGNRLLWLGIGGALLAWCCHRFDYARASAAGWRARRRLERARRPVPVASREEPLPVTAAKHGPLVRGLRQTMGLAGLEVRLIIRSVPFIILLVLGVTFVFFSAGRVGLVRDTPVLPLTFLMTRAVDMVMGLFLMIVLTVYGGEAAWRERSAGAHEMIGALPVSNGVLVAAKLLALGTVAAVFILSGILTTIGFQMGHGFFQLRPGLYARFFLLAVWPYLLLAVLALFLQILTNSKFLGYMLTILVMVSRPSLPFLGVEHYLVRFPGQLRLPYSDMNGYGPHLEAYVWFKVYWSFAALLMAILSGLLLVRGRESSFGARLAAARARFRGPVRAVAFLGVVGFVSSGAFVYYNTNVLNPYLPRGREERLQAEYETLYRQYDAMIQPRVTAVRADVDIFPGRRSVEIHGAYTLRNKSTEVVPALHVTINPRVAVRSLTVGPAGPSRRDPDHGYYIVDLAEPLAPGETAELAFDLSLDNPGFVNHGTDLTVVGNGTFFTSSEYFPAIGYQPDAQLTDPSVRRRLGLPAASRMPDLDDEAARSHNYITRNGGWVDFATTVSTSADQIAVAPGYLTREWTEGGRRYFHYESDAPILDFFSYSSADYQVERDRWNDVAIEIYHHARHGYNVPRMIDAVKKSLDYYTSQFGPYPHRQVRILEFPGYRTFAQAFANTIPVSEAAGFIARLDGDDSYDYVLNTIAHEVAHQWWGHQVIGADVQGATLLSESLAEYSSLMVMEKQYGAERMRRALRYELDGYLRGRGRETGLEMPMLRVENQKYIHYNKGSLVFYALRDYIGETPLNRALARFVDDFAFRGPPYASSRDLMAYLRRETPPELAYLLEDLFETVTLHANRAVSASASPRGDGSWLVKLVVEARKARAGEEGTETQVPVDDWIDIGVFDEDEEDAPLLMEKRRISGRTMQLELVVRGEPASAGIDPYHKLIDRTPDDNVIRVRRASTAE